MVIENVAMLKCESRTKLHAVQYKYQPGLFLLFEEWLNALRSSKSGLVLKLLTKIKAFVLIKLFLYKRE